MWTNIFRSAERFWHFWNFGRLLLFWREKTIYVCHFKTDEKRSKKKIDKRKTKVMCECWWWWWCVNYESLQFTIIVAIFIWYKCVAVLRWSVTLKTNGKLWKKSREKQIPRNWTETTQCEEWRIDKKWRRKEKRKRKKRHNGRRPRQSSTHKTFHTLTH